MDSSSKRYCQPRPIAEILEDILKELRIANRTQEERIVSVTEACVLTGRTRPTLNNWAKKGYLQRYPLGNVTGFKVSELLKVIGQ